MKCLMKGSIDLDIGLEIVEVDQERVERIGIYWYDTLKKIVGVLNTFGRIGGPRYEVGLITAGGTRTLAFRPEGMAERVWIAVTPGMHDRDEEESMEVRKFSDEELLDEVRRRGLFEIFDHEELLDELHRVDKDTVWEVIKH